MTECDAFRWMTKIFHYFDVMVALSLGRAPLSLSYHAECVAGDVDEVFGLTAPLWPMMHELARILALQDVDAMDDIARADAITLVERLEQWRIDEVNGLQAANDNNAVDHETTIQIADAYRLSALLVLQNEVLNDQSIPRNDEIYRQALDSVLRTAALDGPMATLVWPVFTVGRYARSSSDRTVLRHIFSKLFKRQQMRVVESASEKMQLMWAGEEVGASGDTAPVFFA